MKERAAKYPPKPGGCKDVGAVGDRSPSVGAWVYGSSWKHVTPTIPVTVPVPSAARSTRRDSTRRGRRRA